MKRGFLNTKKARSSSTTSSSTPAPSTKPLSRPSAGQTAQKSSASIPEDPLDLQIREDDLIKRTAIITTIPTLPNGGQKSQVITVPSTKNLILQNRGVQTVISIPAQVKYAVRETPDMGLGLFATADIEFGETILTERPFVVLPKNIGMAFKIPNTQGGDGGKWHGVCMDEGEKLLNLALGRMSQEDQDQFRSLCNDSAEDPKKRPLVSILVCNVMNLELDDAPTAQDFGNGYIGIPRTGSRINNSCAPNAIFDFDPDSFSVLYTATRDIKAGDQIFLGYFPASATLAQRQQGMTRYRFVCKCDPCRNATDKTDKLRTDFHVRIANLVRLVMASETPIPPQVLLARALQLKEELEKEGLGSEPKFSEVWIVLQTLYQQLGNSEELNKCQKRLERYSTFPGYRKALKKAQGLPGF